MLVSATEKLTFFRHKTLAVGNLFNFKFKKEYIE